MNDPINKRSQKWVEYIMRLTDEEIITGFDHPVTDIKDFKQLKIPDGAHGWRFYERNAVTLDGEEYCQVAKRNISPIHFYGEVRVLREEKIFNFKAKEGEPILNDIKYSPPRYQACTNSCYFHDIQPDQTVTNKDGKTIFPNEKHYPSKSGAKKIAL